MVAVVSVSIAGAGLLGTLIGFCINNALRQGRNEQRITNLESKEDHNREKFNQLYAFKDTTQTQLATINTNVIQILGDLKDIKLELKNKGE